MKKAIGIIMTYNCAHLLEEIYKRIPKNCLDEIIVVDDGSGDDCRSVAKKLGAKFFSHQHLGYGGNLRFGLKKALEMGADYVVDIHGDGQYDPKVIPQALKMVEKQSIDLLLGTRFANLSQPLKDGMPVERYLSNIVFSFIDRLLFRIPLSEFYNGFGVYSKKLIETVSFRGVSNNYFYNFEIIIQAKFHNLKIAEIPIRCSYFKEHTSEAFWKAAYHAIETFQVLYLYYKAKLGYKTRIFD